MRTYNSAHSDRNPPLPAGPAVRSFFIVVLCAVLLFFAFELPLVVGSARSASAHFQAVRGETDPLTVG